MSQRECSGFNAPRFSVSAGAFLEYFITNVDLIWIDADADGSILEWTVEV
jgi:hypothetical protein